MNTILIIEDNKNYRTIIIQLLNLEHYLTLEAANGKIGLEMIHQHSPNLILCDIDMPIINGLEVLTSVKSDPAFAKIPFIINTGRSDEWQSKMAQDLGAEAYLSKTLSFSELLLVISQLLNPQSTLTAKG